MIYIKQVKQENRRIEFLFSNGKKKMFSIRKLFPKRYRSMKQESNCEKMLYNLFETTSRSQSTKLQDPYLKEFRKIIENDLSKIGINTRELNDEGTVIELVSLLKEVHSFDKDQLKTKLQSMGWENTSNNKTILGKPPYKIQLFETVLYIGVPKTNEEIEEDIRKYLKNNPSKVPEDENKQKELINEIEKSIITEDVDGVGKSGEIGLKRYKDIPKEVVYIYELSHLE